MITIRKITSIREFESLKPVWNALLEGSASRTIALTWEWQFTWWEVFGGRRELNILVASLDAQIVGIAPLLRRTVLHYGLPFTRVEFIGTGEDESEEICSEYIDIIARRGLEGSVVSAMIDYLYEDDASWDEIALETIPATSPTLNTLEEVLTSEWTARRQIVSREVGSYIALPNTYAEYLSRLGANLRRDIRKDRRTALSKQAELRVVDTGAEFDASFQTLIRLHEARWAPKGMPGAYASERFSRFHRLFAERARKDGWVKLFILYVSGKPIAGLQVFAYNKKLLVYQSGLSDADPPVRHPGTLVRDMAIEWAINAGFTEWDMLRTKPASYKLRWASHSREILGLRLARPHSKEMFYSTTAMVVGGLRQIRRALR